MDREDGEMSDDEMHVDEIKPVPLTEDKCTIYKAENDGLIVEKLEKVDALKLEERAKRFGLKTTGNKVITQEQIDELYTNFGIERGNERHFRFDTVFVKGVDGLTTREIFEYFEDYEPVSLEWIDDLSCNVVCHDHISAALALLRHSREMKNESIKEMLFDQSTHWREGMPHPKKDLILMRFATNGDKKMVKKKSGRKTSIDYSDDRLDSVSKNPWGDLCKSWGVYDHQEVIQGKLRNNDYEESTPEPDKILKIRSTRMAMRLGKRRVPQKKYINSEESEESNSDSEWKKKSKAPRMRMHADDEESKQKQKQTLELSKDVNTETYAPLSIEVINSKRDNNTPRGSTKLSDKFKYHNTQKQSIHSRLGEKVVPGKDYSSSDGSSENSDCNIMSKVQRVNNINKSTSSVWSRLETKTNDSNGRSDLRQILKSKKQQKPDDLRGRLGKPKQSNLRIEIDNNYLGDS